MFFYDNFFLFFDFYSFDDIILVIPVFYKKQLDLVMKKKPIKLLEKTHEKTSFWWFFFLKDQTGYGRPELISVRSDSKYIYIYIYKRSFALVFFLIKKLNWTIYTSFF